jgi:outer membrane protein OmpA-like peptidoglycan-associated protein
VDQHDGASQVTRTVLERDVDTRWAHKSPGSAWWLALLAVPLLLAALAAFIERDGIESDLTGASETALGEAGLGDVEVDFDGRDASLSVPDGVTLSSDQLAEAELTVGDVDGVRVVDASGITAATGSGATEDEPTEDPLPSEPAEDCASTAVQDQIDEILGDDKILFQNGKFELSVDAETKVAGVAEILTTCTELPVTVTGNANPGAKPQLSVDRAQAVADALVASGVDVTRISPESQQDNDPRGAVELNRYSDISVQ